MTSSSQERRKRKQEQKRRYEEAKAYRKASKETPFMEFSFPEGQLLSVNGPLIETSIGITKSDEELLIKNNIQVPPPIRATFLIDTGADTCMVRENIAEQASLRLIRPDVPILGVGLASTGCIHLGKIYFSCRSRYVGGHQISIEAEILSGTLPFEERIDGIIGRNVLRAFDFRYHGPSGRYSLRFEKKQPHHKLAVPADSPIPITLGPNHYIDLIQSPGVES